MTVMTLPSIDEMKRWIAAQVGKILEIDPSTIKEDVPLMNYGMDSIAAVSLAGEIEDWLDISLSADAALQYPTLLSLAKHVNDLTRRKNDE